MGGHPEIATATEGAHKELSASLLKRRRFERLRGPSLPLGMTVVFAALACPLSGTAAESPLLNPSAPFWKQTAPHTFHLRFETTKGQFVIEARRDWAPRGVDRFYNLVRTGFFDDSRFFRVRAGFIAQFGIPGDPSIAKIWKDKALLDDPPRESNARGTVAYA